MATQVLTSNLATDSAEQNRRRLRNTVLVAFVVRLVYELYYKSLDLVHGYGGGWGALPYWALAFAPVVALNLIVWARLKKPEARVPIGVAFGVGISEAYRLAAPLWLSEFPLGASALLAPSVFLALVNIVLAAIAISAFRSLKDGRAAALVGIPLGWYFYTAKLIFETRLVYGLALLLH